MSQTIENRIVEMQFENKQFESGVQESLSTLDKLKNALKFDDASKNLQDFSKNINKNIDLSGLSKSVDDVSSKFSASGIAGMEVIRRLTDFAIEAGKKIALALDAPFAQIRQGGWKRAMNIEDAKFQLRGLGITWESVSEDINYAVADTAFGLDAAAKACSQLSASGVEAGDAMKAALRGISGVAAMGNTEYENIADIFTKAAGNGKVMAMELNRVSQYGLNARASLAKFFNAINEGDKSVENIPEHVKERVKAITEGVRVTEADISEFARKSKIDFESFSYAMDNAFGEHAKKANETFMGSLRNIKAALSKIGAEFATPIIQGAIPIFNQIRIFLNDLRKQMGPVFDVFKSITEIVSGKITKAFEKFSYAFLKLGAIEHIGNALRNVFTSLIKILAAVKNAFDAVFPKTNDFNKSVMNITKGVEKFSEKLIISNEAAFAFRNVMVVVFNILKALITAIKNIVPIIGRVLNVALRIVSVIGGLVAYLINLVSNLNIVKTTMNAIHKAGGLFAYAIEKIKDAFGKLRGILSDTTTVTGRFFSKLKEIATMGAYIVGGGLYLAFMKVKDVISYFDTHDPLGSLINGVKTLIDKLKEITFVKEIIHGVETVFGAIVIAINKAIEAVVKFVTEIKNGKSIFEALGTVALGVVGAITTGFTKLTDKIRGVISDFMTGFSKEKVIEESFEAPIANASLGLAGFVQELTLTNKEIGNTKTALEQGRGTLADYQYQLDTTKTTLDKVKIGVTRFGSSLLDSIHNISSSKVLLTAWAGILLVIAFNVNLLIKKLTGLAGTLSNGLGGILRASPTRFDKFRVGLLSITASITALAASIYMLKDVPVDKLQEITKSLLMLIGLVGGLSLLATVINTPFLKFSTGGNGFNFFSSNMFMLAAGVTAIVGSLKILDTVDMNKIWTKVLVLGSIGAGLTAFSILMAKFAPQLSLGSVFMLAFSASILILVKALDNLSHVELDGIVANYKELGVIIVSFAAFAALAGTVGVSSVLSMVAFLLGIRTLLNSFDVIKTKLEEYHVGALLVNVCKKIKEELKAAVSYLKAGFDSLSEFDKKVIVAGIVAFSAGITAMLVGLSKAAKYLKKMAVSATILVASITGVVYAITKIAQICNTIPKTSIDKAMTILEMVGGLFIAVIALSAIFGGDVDFNWDKVGRNAKGKKAKLGTKKFKRSGQTEYLKQARKMMTDMAVLLASVALFTNVVGKLTEDELNRAVPILIGTGIFALVLMGTVTAISAHARSAGKASASLAAFVGMIAVIGTLLGSFVILMNYFKDFDVKSVKDWTQLGLTIASLVGIVFAVHKLTKALTTGGQKTAYKTMASFALLLSAVGLVVTYMTEHLQKEDLGRAGIIALALIVFVGVISGMVLALEKFSNKILSTAKGNSSAAKTKTFRSTIIAIIAMVGATLLLAGTLYSMATNMSGWDVGKMALISLILLATLTALSTIVLAIQHFSKDSLTSITKTSGPKLKQTMAMIGMFLLAFIGLAGVFTLMQGVNPDVMASQMLTIVIALTALTALGLAIQHFVKSMKTDWGTIGKSGAILGGMIALFAALSLVFLVINKLKTEGIMRKSQTLVLVLLELEVLALAASVLGGGGAMAADIALGELTLLGMVALFGVLSLVFIALDKLKTEGIMKKSQTLILVLLELEVLAVGCAVLGGGGAGAADIALGELTLLGMVALFGVLSLVFAVIDKLKVEGIMKKSQTMVLVLLELEVLLAALGIIAPLGVIALAGMPGLLGIVLAMVGIAGAIMMLGDMDLGRIQSTIDIFIDSLNKLLAIAVASGGAGMSLLTIAAGIGGLALACAAAGMSLTSFAVAVTALAVAITKLTATGPSILSWFANISAGVTTLATSIMNSITGLSKSVVIAINTLITGVIAAITNGTAMIFVAAVMLGKKMKEGFDSIVKPQIWGTDLVKEFAGGILSNLGPIINAVAKVAHIIYSYLHFTHPDVGDAASAPTWMPDMMKLFGDGISSNTNLVLGPIGSVAKGIKDAIGNIDAKSIGASIMGGINGGISTGMPQFDAYINHMLESLGMIKKSFASTMGWASSVQLSSTAEEQYHKELSRVQKAQKDYDLTMRGILKTEQEARRSGQNMTDVLKKTTKAREEAKAKLDAEKKSLDDWLKHMQGVSTDVPEATEAVSDFGDAAGKAGKQTKEASDEIADFYDSIAGAIDLFSEFNKQTELTSDQLISNMRSQIEGVSEWANQIQKLAFMGIDQGLLQELAEMGPQGYEYTNAFIHMTADQLAEANNLYHQSLMLPGKVTSQVYGSYAVAGRSAASGFLQGMQKEDIKAAAVGFAHQVVDQMNLALDIQAGKSMVTYEDGVAVVNGVKTGMNAADVQHALGVATDLLTKENIKDKFQKGLFDNKYIYNVGTNITLGLAQGIKDEDANNALRGAVVSVVDLAKNTAKEATQEHSPSKVFDRIGRFITLGLAQGITAETQAATNAMDITADTIIDTMRDTLNKANEALIDGVDDPVIKPVLDLSEIQNGSRELDSLLSRNSAFSASRSFSNLQNEQWNNQSALLNATMDNSDVVGAINGLQEDVLSLKDAMTNIKMVLDTGIMVGAMTPAIDQQLGMRQVLAGRGI